MKICSLIVLMFSFLWPTLFSQTVHWSENFEKNWTNNWYADNGSWEVGIPLAGPTSAFESDSCAATVLAGNYPITTETRLIRFTSFTVPSADQFPRLSFWHWFNFSTADFGKVQIKVSGTEEWIDISNQFIRTSSNVWSYVYLDLSEFAGETVQLGFFFHSHDGGSFDNVSTGWYIDSVALESGPPMFNNPETWENGIGDWYVECGTWEVGTPTTGPGAAYNGETCLATNLGGNYAITVDSRFISSKLVLPSADEFPRFRFWHWFNFSTADYGKIQILPTDSSEWIDISNQYTLSSSNVWSYASIDLSAFAGQEVQFAFYFHSHDGGSFDNVSTGWYIDDISIETGEPQMPNPETWENGIGDWSVECGTWEVGTPTTGPGATYNGESCLATNLAGNYAITVDSRFISSKLVLPGADEFPLFRFWHWFNFSTADYGKIQILPTDSSEWIDISNQYTLTSSNVWSYASIDLSVFAGQEVQIAFYFHSHDGGSFDNVSTGWYIDDISIETGESQMPNPETWETGIGDWYVECGTWEVGTPGSGPSTAYEGEKCLATNLHGNYAITVDSRIVSPYITLPCDYNEVSLRFWHWYSFSTSDYGQVQIKPIDSDSWTAISPQYVNSGGTVWTYNFVDLTDYAGQTVQLAFNFHSHDGGSFDNVSTGWYIDAIEIPNLKELPEFDAGEDASICVGDSIQIGGNPALPGGNPPYDIVWLPNTSISDNTIENPWVKPAASTFYKLSIEGYTECVYDSALITVNPIPGFTLVDVDPIEMPGETETFAIVGEANCSYSFDPAEDNQYWEDGILYVEVSPGSTTNYTIQVQDDDTGCENTGSVEILVEGEVNSTTTKINAKFSLFPNPANTHFVIRGENDITGIAIFSPVGTCVFNQTIKCGHAEYFIDIQDLNTGTYILNVKFGSGHVVQQMFVKQ